MNPNGTLLPLVERLRGRALVVGVVGRRPPALLVRSFFTASFDRAYLFSYIFCLGISLGSLALLMLHRQLGGAWGFLIRRPLEAGGDDPPPDGRPVHPRPGRPRPDLPLGQPPRGGRGQGGSHEGRAARARSRSTRPAGPGRRRPGTLPRAAERRDARRLRLQAMVALAGDLHGPGGDLLHDLDRPGHGPDDRLASAGRDRLDEPGLRAQGPQRPGPGALLPDTRSP